MPVIIFEAGNKMTLEKKRELIRELTDAAVRVTGLGAPAFTIYIHENEHDNIGVGGELLTEILARRG
ncbi:tautomerase family protein [bacterium]|nr:tautomerase family protein [bacterium]